MCYYYYYTLIIHYRICMYIYSHTQTHTSMRMYSGSILRPVFYFIYFTLYNLHFTFSFYCFMYISTVYIYPPKTPFYIQGCRLGYQGYLNVFSRVISFKIHIFLFLSHLCVPCSTLCSLLSVFLKCCDQLGPLVVPFGAIII